MPEALSFPGERQAMMDKNISVAEVDQWVSLRY
jgi:hypothetical protein